MSTSIAEQMFNQLQVWKETDPMLTTIEGIVAYKVGAIVETAAVMDSSLLYEDRLGKKGWVAGFDRLIVGQGRRIPRFENEWIFSTIENKGSQLKSVNQNSLEGNV